MSTLTLEEERKSLLTLVLPVEDDAPPPVLKRNEESHKWERIGHETPPRLWKLDGDRFRFWLAVFILAAGTGMTFGVIAIAGGFNATEDSDGEDLDTLIPTCGDGKEQPEDPFFRVPKEDGSTMPCPCFDPTACAIQCCPWDDPRDEVGNI
eukprot:CAMPEP_0118936282 /NCGR_PEP_ID=MMETSP1169-20130426/17834_1 /TAXON_ID=36882 /ORGANISM="Pyramimonas obovata, Strain CCMP722" /LENGTH=150 /DNA_ID=CAMNT_0006879471 /DNA_START=133 /DNA_END=585 /DNA_ORIENTATION=+